ncbi:MAG: YkgJ family cysteine cluster protein [Roseivirga sp.]|nr:YkgJ family cysteine cluster protein [Roseivirga sp.]
MSTTSSSDLCLKCGICCDGTAFGQAVLENKDLNTATQQISLLDKEGKRILKLPCQALSDCSCTIYANRPKVCATYECILLKQYINGKVTESIAHQTIHRVKSIREEIETQLKETGNENQKEDIHARMRDFERDLLTRMPPVEYRQLHGPLLLKYKVLQKLLIDRFGVQFKSEKSSQ